MADDSGGCLALLIFPVAIGAAACAYFGVFFTTGQQWYEACWAKQNASISGAANAPDAKSAILWENCEVMSQRAYYKNGLMFAPLPENTEDTRGARLDSACPSAWRDLRLGGSYPLTIEVIQKQGGLRFIDKFLPAEDALSEVVKKRWPNCSREREAQGYPKIVETQPGVFAWEAPCTVCKP